MITNEDGQVELYIVDVNLNIFVANLKTFTFKLLLDLSAVLGKLSNADKIVRVMHVNAATRKMFLALADSSLLPVVDLTRGALDWKLPAMQACGTPLAITSDADKAIVAYDTNKLAVFDTINMRLHEWTKQHIDRMPENFLDRYNRIIGLTILNETKTLVFTNYTFCVLDLAASVPKEVDLIQNHPAKTLEGRQVTATGWFDNLKLSQQKYLKRPSQPEHSEVTGRASGNLAISNKYKGILAMQWDNSSNTMIVVENNWQKAVSQFAAGAFVTKKFNQ